MNSSQRQTVLFVGFMVIFSIAVIFLLNNTGASGPDLGSFVPDFIADPINDVIGIYGEMANDVNTTASEVN